MKILSNKQYSDLTNEIKRLQDNVNLKGGTKMKDKFMKNGVFSLEYDKKTLKDMVLELQEESQKQKEVIDKATNWTIKYQTEWCQEDEVIRDLKQLLDILKEVSE